jgi:phosphatidyl-myo-inositol dimannoside synthase
VLPAETTPVTRIIVVTPRLGGADGISEVSRQYLSAVEGSLGEGGPPVEVWSLANEPRPAACGIARFRSAHGSRVMFTAFGLAAHGVNEATLVVVMHLHLLPAVLPLQRRGARVVAVLHGVEAWAPLRPLERAALRSAWRVAAVSRHTRERFRAANPRLASVDVRICHSGVASTTGIVSPGQPTIHQDAPYALIVGRMAAEERYKGHDLLLDVWPIVLSRVPSARLVVVGEGNDRVRLQEKAAALGLQASVVFRGHVSTEALEVLYRGATMFTMPSRNEGLGLVFLEAMQAGVPCVASIGAAEEIIDHGVHGYLVDPDDRARLIDAVVTLFMDGSLRRQMGEAATQRIGERFSRERFVERAHDLLGLSHVPVAC